MDNRPVYLGSYYHPHYNDLEGLTGLTESLDKLPRDATKILAGDFNLPDIDWQKGVVKPSNQRTYKSSEEFCTTLISSAHYHGLEQIVDFPTRKDNILDLFFTSNATLIDSVKPIPGISDHDSIIQVNFKLAPQVQKSKPHKIWKYNKANFDAIKEDLSANYADFASNSTSRTVDENWDSFQSTLLKSMDQNIPSKMSSTRFNVPYMSGEIRRLTRRKQRVYNKSNCANRTKRAKYRAKFEQLRKQVQKTFRQARVDYLNNIIGSSLSENPKAFYSYVKKLQVDSVGIQQLRDKNGINQSDGLEKAKVLNDQFQSVFTSEDLSAIPSMDSPQYPTMAPIQVERKGVEKLLKNLNASKAAGPDCIPSRVLKELASEISPYLTDIFNQSLSTGAVPKAWKEANIVPIFKKGDKLKASNYRPVSLTCIVSKVLEHIVVSSIMKHSDRHKILTEFQHGFRSNHSCETQVLLTAHDLASAYKKKKQVDMVVLDFTKAFDKVPHERLLLKLDHYGIRNSTHQWIRSFLTMRSQSVVLEGAKSPPASVLSGVPQGTVMGPLLFLLYINNLPENLTSSVRLFADDCVLYREINSNEDTNLLQQDLDLLNKWEKKWQMDFNASKCAVLHFSPTKKPVNSNYFIHGTQLDTVSTHKYLGILLSNDFRWDAHIDTIVKTAYQKLGFIRRNTKGMHTNIKQAAYKSLVRPHLEYCSSVWDPHTKKNISRIEQVQRCAARYVTNDYGRTSSVTSMMNQLKWDPLAQRRMFSRLVMAYRIIRGEIAIPKDQFFRDHNTITRGNNTCQLQRYQPRGNIDKYAYAQWTVPEWNSLPAHIVNATTTDSFKNLLREYLSAPTAPTSD